MIHKVYIYYMDRESFMQKHDINIPEFPIVPDSEKIFIAYDDQTKQCKRYPTIYRMLDDEEDCV